MTPPDPSAPKLPRLPDKPDDWECCNRGCCPCIFDYYGDALERWRARVSELGVDPDEAFAAMTAKP